MFRASNFLILEFDDSAEAKLNSTNFVMLGALLLHNSERIPIVR